mmetsp:Transcript_23151/g.65318  ORF Transcript_23151/g.65318 Transcript_23151/m.65318 type:complete len:250 (-) Transcript_23151:574-1323(-)
MLHDPRRRLLKVLLPILEDAVRWAPLANQEREKTREDNGGVLEDFVDPVHLARVRFRRRFIQDVFEVPAVEKLPWVNDHWTTALNEGLPEPISPRSGNLHREVCNIEKEVHAAEGKRIHVEVDDALVVEKLSHPQLRERAGPLILPVCSRCGYFDEADVVCLELVNHGHASQCVDDRELGVGPRVLLLDEAGGDEDGAGDVRCLVPGEIPHVGDTPALRRAARRCRCLAPGLEAGDNLGDLLLEADGLL